MANAVRPDLSGPRLVTQHREWALPVVLLGAELTVRVYSGVVIGPQPVLFGSLLVLIDGVMTERRGGRPGDS